MDSHNLPATSAGAPLNGYSPRTSYAEAEDAGGSVNLKRYLAAVLRYRWLVLGFVIIAVAGAAFATRYATLRYVAEATFWFDNTGREDQARGPIQSSELLVDQAWIELLRSFTVLDHVVLQERMYLEHAPRDRELFAGFVLDSVFRPGSYRFEVSGDGRSAVLRSADGVTVETVQAGAPVGASLGFRWQPPAQSYRPGRESRFQVLMPREAAKQLGAALTTRLPRGGSFMGLKYTGEDPRRVASVVNAIADRYTEVAADLKSAKLDELREILASQLQYAQQNLAEAEMRLESYRVNTITLPSEVATPVTPGLDATTGTVLSSYFGMKIQHEELQRDRGAILRAVARPDSVSVDALAIVGAVQQSPEMMGALSEVATKRAELRALRQQYTDEHPLVQRALADLANLERGVVPQLGRRLASELDSRMEVLDGMVGSASGELRQIPPRVIEEARLRRSVAIGENLYNDLRRRYEGTRLAAETAVPDVRVLDRATVPTVPMSDPRIVMLLSGLAVGLGLGVLVAILLDRADPRLRYVEQVTEDLRLPVIGAVPSLRAARKGLLPAQDTSRVLESLRAVRLSLMHAYGSAGPIIVTVSSPGSGDGKTFVASNLALTFADLGLKTLLIDGDTRRGALHRMMGLDRRPGLTDYLSGDAEAAEVIRDTSYPLVKLISGGSRRSDSPELLSSPAMGELLARIKSEYQVVLIDSPPLGAGVDPLVLGTLSGHMLLVMRTGRTERAHAEAKLQMLDRLPIRVLGVVLNGFDTSDAYKYYSYLPGYEAHGEESDMAQLQPV
ncbi:MAG TPA: polysaccharide biosynthesis tyrosine autokinase [Longimicrobiales bacterium]|nr:polysaccharide biosynthesis tyrosine autokinase [Longimicrobiales bacterium]